MKHQVKPQSSQRFQKTDWWMNGENKRYSDREGDNMIKWTEQSVWPWTTNRMSEELTYTDDSLDRSWGVWMETGGNTDIFRVRRDHRVRNTLALHRHKQNKGFSVFKQLAKINSRNIQVISRFTLENLNCKNSMKLCFFSFNLNLKLFTSVLCFECSK